MALESITIVTGLPGCGKTTWSQKQCEMLGALAVLVDDPSVDVEQWGLVTDDHAHAFVADPYWCIMPFDDVIDLVDSRLPAFDREKTLVKWVAFENDLEQCLLRARPNVNHFIRRLHECFTVPAGAQMFPLNTTLSWFDVFPVEINNVGLHP